MSDLNNWSCAKYFLIWKIWNKNAKKWIVLISMSWETEILDHCSINYCRLTLDPKTFHFPGKSPHSYLPSDGRRLTKQRVILGATPLKPSAKDCHCDVRTENPRKAGSSPQKDRRNKVSARGQKFEMMDAAATKAQTHYSKWMPAATASRGFWSVTFAQCWFAPWRLAKRMHWKDANKLLLSSPCLFFYSLFGSLS